GTTLLSRRYWQLDEVEMSGGYDRRRLDRLEETFGEACRAVAGDGDVGIALSGGLDSRCLVAAVTAVCDGLSSFTEGPTDSHDYRLAELVADTLDLPHRQLEIREESVGEWLEPAVSLLGGNVATLEVNPCHHFLEPSLPFDRILLGLVGEYSRAAYPKPTDYGAADFETLLRRVRIKVLTPLGKRPDLKRLWLPECAHLAAWPAERLEDRLRAYQWQHSPIDVADYYYLEHRGRRALAKGPTLGRLGTETATPYLDPRWVEEVFSIPTPDRLGSRIQLDLVERFAPGLRAIPCTSPPAYTTKWQERIGERKRKWQQRLARHKRKETPAFDTFGWSRGVLRPVLEDTLYSPDARFRAYLEWTPVRERLDAHFEGRARHTHLVAALASFEIAHRMWAGPAVPDRVRPEPERTTEALEV
ncbi:MAG: hypothetical protein KAJ43_09575, partial [Gemmatimonadetes bacterium]|nr:hypothetical protein [Gemmatimonadota bacterium]